MDATALTAMPLTVTRAKDPERRKREEKRESVCVWRERERERERKRERENGGGERQLLVVTTATTRGKRNIRKSEKSRSKTKKQIMCSRSNVARSARHETMSSFFSSSPSLVSLPCCTTSHFTRRACGGRCSGKHAVATHDGTATGCTSFFNSSICNTSNEARNLLAMIV